MRLLMATLTLAVTLAGASGVARAAPSSADCERYNDLGRLCGSAPETIEHQQCQTMLQNATNDGCIAGDKTKTSDATPKGNSPLPAPAKDAPIVHAGTAATPVTTGNSSAKPVAIAVTAPSQPVHGQAVSASSVIQQTSPTPSTPSAQQAQADPSKVALHGTAKKKEPLKSTMGNHPVDPDADAAASVLASPKSSSSDSNK